MKTFVKITDPTKIDADVVVVFGWQGKKEEEVEFSDEAKYVDRACESLLRQSIDAEGFKPKAGETFVINARGSVAAKRVMLVGAGDLKELTAFDLLVMGAALGRRAKGSKAKRIAISLSTDIANVLGITETTQLLVEGIRLGTYEFTKHKGKKDEKKKEEPLAELVLLTAANRLNQVEFGVTGAMTVGDAVSFARDLVNEPPSVTTPTHLGEVAKTIARGHTNISCELLGPKEMKTLGMGGLLGIAQGSDEEPRFIVLRYKGGGRKTVALVGKGITFDTGGLSLKPADHMETMKLDMAGAATILGIFSVLPIVKPKVTVVGLISATENMPSGRAIKPGDVVTAMNGKTMEILNTDAEGRVVLADALSYAVAKIKPDAMIDLATLTGACMVALGQDVAGLFANDEDLARDLLALAEKTGEHLWQLPLVKEYQELIKSTVADIKNIGGGRYGGAITAALFLQEFTDEHIPWAHLDIAGPAFAEKDAPTTPRGGTGYGVRMLLRFLQTFK